MLPKFISVSLADKILSVGKSINFLREICCDDKPFSQRDRIRDVFLNTDGIFLILIKKIEFNCYLKCYYYNKKSFIF